jgi:hypothetical protein
MSLPNFLIIGAAKAGTTSLYYYLKQHPQIYMSPIKEPRFFAFKDKKPNFQGPACGINQTSITNYQDYYALFKDVQNEVAIGEASTIYLYSTIAAKQIKQDIPGIKLIIVLRDPIERAYSSFSHLTRDGYETLSFINALKEEEKRIANNWSHLWHYKNGGFYYAQVKQYLEIFAPEQIKIYLYEDLKYNPQLLIQDVYQFLGVDPNFLPDLAKQNISGKPKSRLLVHLFKRDNYLKSFFKPFLTKQIRDLVRNKIIQINMKEKPDLPSKIRQDLINVYRKDMLNLQDLIQRDLSAWLK